MKSSAAHKSRRSAVPRKSKPRRHSSRATRVTAQAGSPPPQRELEATRPTPGSPTLELYQKEDCPFSHAVRNRLSQLGLDFVAHNIPDGDAEKHEKLLQAGGKDQIPFLIDHKTGMELYESESIIDYLDREYAKRQGEGKVVHLFRKIDARVQARADEVTWMVRRPMDRARALRRDMGRSFREVVDTLQGSVRVIGDAVQKAIASRK